jgi:asparaginyl-tRNA synthetase
MIKRGTATTDEVTTPFGIRTISWPVKRNDGDGRFYLNNKPVFLNGVCEYEHQFGQSHAFSKEQVAARVKQMKAAGFNAFRDAHQPHNLDYQRYWDEEGVLFWMIEPEVAFNDINDNMDLAEEFIKYCVQWALDNCYDDVKFLNDMFDKGLIERLQGVLKESFVRLPYTEGIKILEEAVANGHKFEFPVYWGVDLASEHERFLVEEHFKRPVILTDYPKEIKAFYMKQNEDGKTVRAMDVLFPKIGEIIGGSEREADYDKLLTRIQELNIPMKDMWWYLDTRKYGSCPHSGFGLGFERLLLFVTGMANIRDVIPFPRTPRNAEF